METDRNVHKGIHFRNYRPFDRDLLEYHLDYQRWKESEVDLEGSEEDEWEEARKRVVSQDPILNSRPTETVTVEVLVKQLLEEAREKDTKSTENQEDQRIDLMKLAPREPNWDLKRDLQPKLDRLEKRTKRAILELVKERLHKDTLEGSNLVEAIEIQEKIHMNEEQTEEEL